MSRTNRKTSFEPVITAFSGNSSYESRVVHKWVIAREETMSNMNRKASFEWFITTISSKSSDENKWVVSYTNKSCHAWRNHVTNEQKGFLRVLHDFPEVVTPPMHTNESCDTGMSHVTVAQSHMKESCHRYTETCKCFLLAPHHHCDP